MVYIVLDEPLTPYDSDIEETKRWPQPDILLLPLPGVEARLFHQFFSGCFFNRFGCFCGCRPAQLFGGGSGWLITACGTTRCGFLRMLSALLSKPCLKTELSG